MRIKEERKNKGFSQYKLAKILGVSQGALSRWENGKRKLPHEMLNSIAKALDTKPWKLLTNEREKMSLSPLRWIRGCLAYILRQCFNCMVIYPKEKKNGK